MPTAISVNRPRVSVEAIVFQGKPESGKLWHTESAEKTQEYLVANKLDGVLSIRVAHDCLRKTDYRGSDQPETPHTHDPALDNCWKGEVHDIPFVFGPHRKETITYKAGDGKESSYERIRWGWDGNTESPTLDPSILTWTDRTWGKMRFHIFFHGGRIQLLSDSTLTLPDGTVIPMVLA
jgi:hypothetical protein